jgi:lipopolysaccharide transport system permease protein
MQDLPAPQVIVTSSKPDLRRLVKLTWSLAVGDLKRQYVGSALDVVWAVVKPLIELLTYAFVFTVLLRVRFHPDYPPSVNALYLFCGWLVFITVHESITRSTDSVRDSVHLIRKVHVPAEILPAYLNFSEQIVLIFRVSLLLAASVIVGWGVSPWALLLPIVMFFQFLFTYGIGLVLSTLSVFYKDARQLLSPVLMIWMFITPVFYPENVFPRPFTPILIANPLSHLIGIYRQILLNHQPPLPGQVIIFGASAITCFAVGWWVFRRQSPYFSDIVGG